MLNFLSFPLRILLEFMFLKGFIVVLYSDHQTLADFTPNSLLFSTVDMHAKFIILFSETSKTV
jgi:hypothetical protein